MFPGHVVRHRGLNNSALISMSIQAFCHFFTRALNLHRTVASPATDFAPASDSSQSSSSFSSQSGSKKTTRGSSAAHVAHPLLQNFQADLNLLLFDLQLPELLQSFSYELDTDDTWPASNGLWKSVSILTIAVDFIVCSLSFFLIQ